MATTTARSLENLFAVTLTPAGRRPVIATVLAGPEARREARAWNRDPLCTDGGRVRAKVRLLKLMFAD